MISNCANPACNKPFHYLRGGRLYRFDAPLPQLAFRSPFKRGMRHEFESLCGVLLVM